MGGHLFAVLLQAITASNVIPVHVNVDIKTKRVMMKKIVRVVMIRRRNRLGVIIVKAGNGNVDVA